MNDEEIVYIICHISKYTYDRLVIVSEQKRIDMKDIVEYCLNNIVDEFS